MLASTIKDGVTANSTLSTGEQRQCRQMDTDKTVILSVQWWLSKIMKTRPAKKKKGKSKYMKNIRS